MQRVMHYDLADEVPTVFRTVNRRTFWKLEAKIQQTADSEPLHVVVRVVDKMRLTEVSDVFLDEIARHLPEDAPVHSASVDFWADV